MKFEIWACKKPTSYKGIHTIIYATLISEISKEINKISNYDVFKDLASFMLGDE